MELKLEEKRIIAAPCQLIAIESGIIIKRGSLETHVAGARAAETVGLVMDGATKNGALRSEILAQFAAPDRPAVAELIELMINRSLLLLEGGDTTDVLEDETPIDIFYWNFGCSAREIASHFDQRSIVILGVNTISRQIVSSLAASRISAVEVVDYPLLRNLRLFDADGALLQEEWPGDAPRAYQDWSKNLVATGVECLVATSDFGGLHWMRQWNEICVQNRIHFFPVVLQNLIGYVGPIVVPGETACFECVRARQNSHLHDIELERAAEHVAFDGQAVVGFHPSMALLLGDVAAFELARFYGGGLPHRTGGTLIMVDLISRTMSPHKVLKVPRCPVCSPLMTQPAASPLKTAFLPGNQAER